MDELLDLQSLETSEDNIFYCSGYFTLDGMTPIQARIMFQLRTGKWISCRGLIRDTAHLPEPITKLRFPLSR